MLECVDVAPTEDQVLHVGLFLIEFSLLERLDQLLHLLNLGLLVA